MLRSLKFCLLPLSFFAFACSGTVETPDDAGDGDPVGDGDAAPDGGLILGSPADGSDSDPAWLEIQACGDDVDSDPIDIDSVSLDGDQLTINAAHGGGCAEHSYALCYGQEWANSNPVQIRAELVHDDGDDTCEAYLGAELQFDLTPLRDAFTRGYQSMSGEISLGIGQERIIYSFGEEEGRPTEASTWEEIRATIDELNSCETTADCKAVQSGDCSTGYINSNADSTELDAMIESRNNVDGGVACLAVCECAALSCSAGRCETRSNDCQTLEGDELNVCL